MGRSSRRKGKDAEGEVANIFRAHGFTVSRTPNSGGLHVRGDVIGVPGFHIEVKRQETLRLPLWRRQAEAECGDCIPVVIYRRNNEDWRVTARAKDYLTSDWSIAARDGWFVAELGWWLDWMFPLIQDAAMHAAPEREAAPSDRETGA